MRTFTDKQRIDFLAYWIRRGAWLEICECLNIRAYVNPEGSQDIVDTSNCIWNGISDYNPDFRVALDEIIDEAIEDGVYVLRSEPVHHSGEAKKVAGP